MMITLGALADSFLRDSNRNFADQAFWKMAIIVHILPIFNPVGLILNFDL